MLQNLKALVVVMGLALIVFAVARPLCLRFMAPEDFTRRRNVWIALTVIAFASPNFWLYAVIAMAVFAWAARRDSNPLALYVMMLHVIPPIGLYIPAIGINHLFELNNYRMLSLAVLVPLAIRVMRAPAAHPARHRQSGRAGDRVWRRGRSVGVPSAHRGTRGCRVRSSTGSSSGNCATPDTARP